MIRQSEGLKHNPRLMLIDDADRPAKWYFRVEAESDRVQAQRFADGAPNGWAGNTALEKLRESPASRTTTYLKEERSKSTTTGSPSGGSIWMVAEVSVKAAAGYSKVRVAPERTQASSVH